MQGNQQSRCSVLTLQKSKGGIATGLSWNAVDPPVYDDLLGGNLFILAVSFEGPGQTLTLCVFGPQMSFLCHYPPRWRVIISLTDRAVFLASF